jgi:hypothetical protein
MTDAAMLGPARYERRENDAYDTPDWCTEALLMHWRPRGLVWEPACGAGAIANVLSANGYDVLQTDIAPRIPGAGPSFVGDFLSNRWDLLSASIVTNPPYDKAEAFVRQALRLTEENIGAVAMLLRNEWDCAGGRRDLFTMPAFAMKVTLTKRPRWIEGSTGAPRHNFSWFIWDWQNTGPPIVRYS